ncbi:hypothetical protein [Sulfitobacter sp. R18_1]|uniref:hypothetical protein n=1 Tax=Sulfitobacter sp. R18_1 TaxID=2821104 RepID=UPI001ADC6271|nr:hypothetical protein [Sulfitobacter sp. R18_1]MBO9428236.1 hypothetical protein [Sulfitobacter sp. R18_1]
MKNIALFSVGIILAGFGAAWLNGSPTESRENPNYVYKEGITLEQKDEDVFTCKVEVGGILSQDLRLEAKDRCLKDKGYKLTSFPIPKCGPKHVQEGFITPETPIRKPAKGACWTEGTKHASVVIFPEAVE